MLDNRKTAASYSCSEVQRPSTKSAATLCRPLFAAEPQIQTIAQSVSASIVMLQAATIVLEFLWSVWSTASGPDIPQYYLARCQSVSRASFWYRHSLSSYTVALPTRSLCTDCVVKPFCVVN